MVRGSSRNHEVPDLPRTSRPRGARHSWHPGCCVGVGGMKVLHWRTIWEQFYASIQTISADILQSLRLQVLPVAESGSEAVLQRSPCGTTSAVGISRQEQPVV